MKWVLIMVFAGTGQMGYKFHETEKDCYKTAVHATKLAKKSGHPMKWKCIRENDPAYNALMEQINRHRFGT